MKATSRIFRGFPSFFATSLVSFLALGGLAIGQGRGNANSNGAEANKDHSEGTSVASVDLSRGPGDVMLKSADRTTSKVSPVKGNNGVGNGEDPQPPGNPRINDGPGTSPGHPGNRPPRP